MKHDTEVHIIDNLSSGFLKNIPFVNNEHIYIKDITDFEFVTVNTKEQFDFVIHLAAMVSVVETIENQNYPIVLI